jgi:cytochrome d ubiquinol oxidase subunit II
MYGLETIWFALVALLLAGYAVLDGFDLGVGALSLLARSREERDLHVAAIGPVWDGNEVWLLTGGGALFAAFPVVYATVFSGFYLALMLLLVALMARAVSMEFRALVPSQTWVRAWDWAFGLGSLLPSVLLGVALGNVLRGVPIGPAPDRPWEGSFLGLLNPYAILVGLVSCALFVMHGAIYLRMKTEGELADRLRTIALGAFVVFLSLYAIATAATVLVSPSLFQKAATPGFWILTLVLVVALAATPLAVSAGRRGLAFIASSVLIVTMIAVAAFSAYPIIVPSSIAAANSLTITNSASTPRTLTAMLVIALIGVPLMLAYTVFVYRIFKGKARPAEGYGAAEAEEAPPVKAARIRPARGA